MKSFPIEQFKEVAINQGHSQEYIDFCLKYANQLIDKNYPVIFTIEHLAVVIGVESDYLRFLVGDIKHEQFEFDRFEYKEKRYNYFKFTKKRGGYREIMAPHKDLKYIQKWLLFNILDKYPFKNSCKGFRQGISIKDNALPHEKSDVILKVDLLKFYDTITEKRIYGVFKTMGFHGNLAVSLAKLCTAKHQSDYWENFTEKEKLILSEFIKTSPSILPQGAPSSPALANIVATRMDGRFDALSKKMNFSYSRYADDLTFSVKEKAVLPPLKLISKIIQEEGFYINEDKIQYMKRGNKQFVTGLTIANGVHTSKKYRKQIARHIHFCRKYGVENHLDKNNKEFKGYNILNFHDWLYGHICYINSVDKEASKKMLNDFNKITWSI
ncbi:reverse transcriptase family protein [Chryseobacterium scophthalmum]|uniref:reverse transcriptase family protein n=1 Tax=Chryseobacterium scophthalmum TaxID=59733 RepID=UPI001AEBDDA5|nr:reverse transcriptase family protein [Chryseobacterium scophthalmum]